MIILDTHAWIFWLDDPEKLGSGALEAIDEADSLGLSTFSCLEAGILLRKGKISVNEDPERWLERATNIDRLRILAMTPSIAFKAALLEDFHADPADRVIVTTCRYYGAPLVTRDRLIGDHKMVETIW